MKNTENFQKKLENIEQMLQKGGFRLKNILSLAEAAEYLQTSKAQLYKLTSERTIPFYKPNGKKIYFKRDELDEWVYGSRVSPHHEIEEEASNYILKRGRVA